MPTGSGTPGTDHLTHASLLRSAGALVVAQLRKDDEASAFIFDGLSHRDAADLALVLALWSAEWLKLVCDIGGIYRDDPVAVMQDFLLEQAVELGEVS